MPDELIRSSVPVPDPTTLTTEQSTRAIAGLRDLLQTKIDALEAVMTERFVRIDTLFTEGDKRTQQLSAANSLALAAALQAAKEAVGEQNRSSALAIAKSEAATAESIKQLQTLFQSANQATNEKVDDLKSRLDKGEGSTTGGREQRAEAHLSQGMTVGLIVACVTVATLILAVAQFAMRVHP